MKSAYKVMLCLAVLFMEIGFMRISFADDSKERIDYHIARHRREQSELGRRQIDLDKLMKSNRDKRNRILQIAPPSRDRERRLQQLDRSYNDSKKRHLANQKKLSELDVHIARLEKVLNTMRDRDLGEKPKPRGRCEGEPDTLLPFIRQAYDEWRNPMGNCSVEYVVPWNFNPKTNNFESLPNIWQERPRKGEDPKTFRRHLAVSFPPDHREKVTLSQAREICKRGRWLP